MKFQFQICIFVTHSIFQQIMKIIKSFVGAYVPLTEQGKIIVDGVLTSCYADVNHDLAHLTMAPMQRFADVLDWIFGDDTEFPIYQAAGYCAAAR